MHENDQDDIEQLISDLYSDASQEQPSSELDEKIVSAAKKELQQQSVEDNSGKNAGLFSGKWSGPVSLAAVIVLSVTVVVTIEKERPYSLTSPPEVNPPTVQTEESREHKPIPQVLEAKKQNERPVLAKKKFKESMNEKPVSEPEVLALMQQVRPEPEKVEKQARPEPKADTESGVASRSIPAAVDKDKKFARITSEIAVGKNEEKASGSGIVATLPSSPPPSSSPSFSSPKPVRKLVTTDRPATVSSASEPEKVEQAAEDAGSVESVAAEAESVELADADVKTKDTETMPAEQLAASGAMAARSDKMELSPVQTFATGENRSQQKDQDNCSALSIGVCLSSRSCVVEPDTGSQQYLCRRAKNSCESDFSQLVDKAEVCEAKDGCKYQPAKCFCPPGIECVCGGGPPAMCIPE